MEKNRNHAAAGKEDDSHGYQKFLAGEALGGGAVVHG
jgi:hypothetical protein